MGSATKAVLGLAVLLALAIGVIGLSTMSGDYRPAPVSETQRAEARAYLASALAPLPRDTAFGAFTPEAGVSLETLRIRRPGAKGTVVIAPGFTAPLEYYASTITAFADAGYDVAALSHRGQGRSSRPLAFYEKAYIEDYDRLALDLALFIAGLEAEGAGPILLYGNSMGGHISLLMASTIEIAPRAIALNVPMGRIKTGAFPYEVARTLSTALVAFGFGENYGVGQEQWTPEANPLGTPTDCSADPAQANARDALYTLDERLRVEGVTNQWVAETMASTELLLQPGFLLPITAPVFMVTAGDDRIVDTEASNLLCDGLRDCTLRHFDESRHCIMREAADVRATIQAETIAFFDRAIGR